MGKRATYVDLGDHDEATRIATIGTRAMLGELVAFIVETGEKADRYVRKLKQSYPRIVEIDRFDGPVANTISVRVCRGDRLEALRAEGRVK